MPILRLTKTDPEVAVVDVKLDMSLAYTGFDGQSYTFDWTGRGGLLPLWAVDKAINPNNRTSMLRSFWVLADAAESGSWEAEDVVANLSKRLGQRTGHIISQLPIRLPVVGPYDRLSFQIGAKAVAPGGVYSFDILINTLDEGDVGFPEVPVLTT